VIVRLKAEATNKVTKMSDAFCSRHSCSITWRRAVSDHSRRNSIAAAAWARSDIFGAWFPAADQEMSQKDRFARSPPAKIVCFMAQNRGSLSSRLGVDLGISTGELERDRCIALLPEGIRPTAPSVRSGNTRRDGHGTPCIEVHMNQADTAWMLIATALVLLMTPALAFFYGGLVRSKNSLNTMMMSFISLGFVGVLWALLGYSLAFSTGNNWIGDLSNAFLRGVGLEVRTATTIPHALFMSYQGTFAIITAALISGAIVERMRFSAYVTFISIWALAVYSPIAHWVWGGGWLAKMGALDFAGGTVVHVNAAVAALAAAVVVGRRSDHQKASILPHNVPFVLLGAGLLWFGWFGFNAGSALAASPIAGLAFVTTMLAPAATLVVWTIIDVVRTGKPTSVGAATAIVVGLVAVTPAAGFISPMSALALGGIAAIPSYFAIQVRAKTSLDDSLDVIAAHGVGGTVGALLTGVFAEKALNGVADGVLFGNPKQILVQGTAVLAAIVYSGVVSFVLLKAIALVMPLRATGDEEATGLDIALHGEEAYLHDGGMEAVTPIETDIFQPVPAPAKSAAVSI
jgi:ammonium transporter, Amt family